MSELAEALYARAGHLAATYRERNVLRILALLEEAAEYDHPGACFDLGTWYHHGIGVARDSVRATRLWERAAGGGHSEARFAFAIALERGTGIAADPERAFATYRQCADAGLVAAWYEVARCRYYGIGTPVDRVGAERDFMVARRYGHAEAACDAAEDDGPRRMPRRSA